MNIKVSITTKTQFLACQQFMNIICQHEHKIQRTKYRDPTYPELKLGLEVICEN